MMRKKIIQLVSVLLLSTTITMHPGNASAQIKLEDIVNIDLNSILGTGNLIKIDKGFSPVFKLGNYQINTVGILGEKLKGVEILGDILGKKGVNDIMKMYRTYKTGLVVYKVLSSAGTVVTAVGVVKGISADNKFDDKDVKALIYPALGSVATGVITKLLTKQASYKAVDIFNGVARKTLRDILSIGPASNTIGVGVYVKL